MAEGGVACSSYLAASLLHASHGPLCIRYHTCFTVSVPERDLDAAAAPADLQPTVLRRTGTTRPSTAVDDFSLLLAWFIWRIVLPAIQGEQDRVQPPLPPPRRTLVDMENGPSTI
ncbi:hypothetical protein ON010_g15926 [Phytophthora cinnamomi]|nr:hypothetical protein ON010_g15926 [Phytophthora cinnamomi]